MRMGTRIEKIQKLSIVRQHTAGESGRVVVTSAGDAATSRTFPLTFLTANFPRAV